MSRPGRPLGVSLAILASLFMFTVLPLLQVGMVLVVRQHFVNLDFGDELEPVAMGGDFLGIPEERLILQAVLSVIFLILAILAWRGRPRSMRFILVLAVVGMTLVQFVIAAIPVASDQQAQGFASSGETVLQTLAASQQVFSLLVALYVVWYMNRGPARAFYRGYYLPEAQ